MNSTSHASPVNASLRASLIEPIHAGKGFPSSKEPSCLVAPVLLETVANVIESIWPNEKRSSVNSENVTPLRRFLSEVLYRTHSSYATTILSLLYVFKLRAKLSSSSARLTWIASMSIANKFLIDRSFSCRTWARVASFSKTDLIKAESSLLKMLDYRLYIPQPLFMGWIDFVVVHMQTLKHKMELYRQQRLARAAAAAASASAATETPVMPTKPLGRRASLPGAASNINTDKAAVSLVAASVRLPTLLTPVASPVEQQVCTSNCNSTPCQQSKVAVPRLPSMLLTPPSESSTPTATPPTLNGTVLPSPALLTRKRNFANILNAKELLCASTTPADIVAVSVLLSLPSSIATPSSNALDSPCNLSKKPRIDSCAAAFMQMQQQQQPAPCWRPYL